MKVVLPWPDRKLSPNSRAHWAVIANAKAKARKDAAYATYAAMEGGVREVRLSLAGEGPITFKVTFYPPDKRQRDDDNLVSMVKAARDGIADALGVNDRRFRSEYYFEDPCRPGRVEVDLSPLSPAQTAAERSSMGADSATQKIGPSGAPTPPSRDPISNQERTE